MDLEQQHGDAGSATMEGCKYQASNIAPPVEAELREARLEGSGGRYRSTAVRPYNKETLVGERCVQTYCGRIGGCKAPEYMMQSWMRRNHVWQRKLVGLPWSSGFPGWRGHLD